MENIVSMVTLVNWKSPVISLLMKIETCNLEAHLRKFQFFIRQKTHYFSSVGSSFYETSKVGHFWRWTERGPANLKFMTPILKPLYSLSPWRERTTFSRQPPLPFVSTAETSLIFRPPRPVSRPKLTFSFLPHPEVGDIGDGKKPIRHLIKTSLGIITGRAVTFGFCDSRKYFPI